MSEHGSGASRAGEPWLASRLEQLQRLSTELSSAPDAVAAAQELIAVLDSPARSATHGVWLFDRSERKLVLAAQSGMPDEAAASFAKIDVDADLPVAAAHRERRTVQNTTRAQSEEEFEGLQGATRVTEGFVAVPLVAEGRSLGALSLGFNRQPTAEDLLFMEAIAGQMAQTLVRIRLTERDRRRRAELEFLVELTDAASVAADHAELMANVADAAVPTLGDWCAIHFLPDDGGPAVVAIAHVDPAKVSWARELQQRYPYDPTGETGVPAVIRSGVTEFVSAVDELYIDDAIARSAVEETEARSIADQLALTSVITVPLRTKRRTVGAIQFVSAESKRRYDEDDVALAEVVASRLAEPLDSAWTIDQQARIAGALQRNLLPPRIPLIDGLDIAARYLPAGVSSVGGDFYDVFSIGEQSWAILIGDACGTGPDAAALSSIARHTVRAAARHGLDHQTVIEWLNEAIALSDRDLFCTACYATLTREGEAWHWRSASAGHPLPIRLAGSGGATAVGRAGTLLGVFDQVEVCIDEVDLEAGEAMVLYTDGVTDLPPPYGLATEDLHAFVGSIRGDASADDVADAIEGSLVERVSEPHRLDDVAIVVIRVQR